MELLLHLQRIMVLFGKNRWAIDIPKLLYYQGVRFQMGVNRNTWNPISLKMDLNNSKKINLQFLSRKCLSEKNDLHGACWTMFMNKDTIVGTIRNMIILKN